MQHNNMDKIKLQKLEDDIRNASPLELVSKLQEAELLDEKETRAVIDEVYEEFEKQGNRKDGLLYPIFLSMADGLLESTAATRRLRKMGLTATRIVSQCQSFSYDQRETEAIIPDGYTEWKNAKDYLKDFSENERPKYHRSEYEDKKRMNAYKEEKFANNGGSINATDEYTGKKNVYQYRSNPDARWSIEKHKHDHQAEVDHIIPLKQLDKQFKGNYALPDEDIKNIANSDDNFALTSARINRGAGAPDCGGKFEKTNEEFVKKQREKKKKGEPHLGLSEDAEENMLQMSKAAQKEINKKANKKVFENLTGQGTGNTKDIWGKAASNAANQSKNYVIGNVILFIIKPLYYEISDAFKNGLKEGVNADSTIQAFKIRFGRVKQYVLDNIKPLLKENMWEFVKGFISSLIEGIISLFVGIFKQILKVVKEGVKIFVQAGQVLFGKHSAQMTTAQKGDAIIKILGGSVLAICGIGIEALLNKIGVPEPWSVVLSTFLTGVASALFMILLDKIDLFSVKAENRRLRIKEIFNERIADIKEAERTFNTAVLETIRTQRLQFAAIEQNLHKAIKEGSIDAINSELFKLAAFMKVDLGYTSKEEFVNNFDNMEIVL